MAFKKYAGLENHYRTKEIEWWLNQRPALKTCTYVVQEKIHGANFQVEVGPDGVFHLGKRSGRIAPGEKFYNYVGAFDAIKDRLEVVAGDAQRYGVTYHLHGELFGGGVQKGVNYGGAQRILFFDMRCHGHLVSPKVFYSSMKMWGIADLVVPTVGWAEGLAEALAFPHAFDSKVLGVPDNKAEGVVIKPFDDVCRSNVGSVFMVKHKCEEFVEKKSARRQKHTGRDISEAAQALHWEFISYLVEERLQGLFSKLGPIESYAQIGTYIKAESESHADAGDRANDAIRVNGAEIAARVIGE